MAEAAGKTLGIIGRKKEQILLNKIYNSKDPEFVAVYGRRRVGKSYLVKNFFENKDCIYFDVLGVENEEKDTQLAVFADAMSERFYHSGLKPETPKNWYAAFKSLNQTLKEVAGKKKVVLFFDEVPWLATLKSGFLQALSYYWNKYWSHNPKIKLIVCGSAASWIIDKIINAKGGLHNRITQRIRLEPFSLGETKQFLQARGIHLDDNHVLNLYMVLGGIPFYLKHVEKGLSSSQNIDRICFTSNGVLFDEFPKLYRSLFENSEIYMTIIRIAAAHRNGIEKTKLISLAKQKPGGTMTKVLSALEEAGFLESFLPIGHSKRGTYYRLIDEYSLFYLNWIEPVMQTIKRRKQQTGYWEAICQRPAWQAWSGYAFEAVCFKHVMQIAKALNIAADAEIGSWRYIPKDGSEEGAQVDLLFDRYDGIVNLVEIKYASGEFVVNRACAEQLLKRMKIYKSRTKTKKQIFISMVCANGLKSTLYSDDLVDGVVTARDLFVVV